MGATGRGPASTARQTEAPQRAAMWRIWLELATVAAAQGDASLAREASPMPLLVDDIVRARAGRAAIVAP